MKGVMTIKDGKLNIDRFHLDTAIFALIALLTGLYGWSEFTKKTIIECKRSQSSSKTASCARNPTKSNSEHYEQVIAMKLVEQVDEENLVAYKISVIAKDGQYDLIDYSRGKHHKEVLQKAFTQWLQSSDKEPFEYTLPQEFQESLIPLGMTALIIFYLLFSPLIEIITMDAKKKTYSEVYIHAFFFYFRKRTFKNYRQGKATEVITGTDEDDEDNNNERAKEYYIWLDMGHKRMELPLRFSSQTEAQENYQQVHQFIKESL